MTQTVPDISPLMPMHQDPLLVCKIAAILSQSPCLNIHVSWQGFLLVAMSSQMGEGFAWLYPVFSWYHFCPPFSGPHNGQPLSFPSPVLEIKITGAPFRGHQFIRCLSDRLGKSEPFIGKCSIWQVTPICITNSLMWNHPGNIETW